MSFMRSLAPPSGIGWGLRGMSALIAHLNVYGLDPAWFDARGVNVKPDDSGRHLLKYRHDAKWCPVVLECRGSIVRETRGGWVFDSRPFDKFFNLHEGHCAYTDDMECTVVEKLDGSLIRVWWDLDVEAWVASTLGTIEAGSIGGKNFSDMFWEEYPGDFSGCLGYTHMFELCRPENRIVNDYSDERLFYLGSRHNVTGDYWHDSTIRVPRPLEYNPPKGREALARWVDSDFTGRGTRPEGVVVRDSSGRPVAKVKTSAYRHLHNFAGGPIEHCCKMASQAVWDGCFDDVCGVLPPTALEYAEQLRRNIRAGHKIASGWGQYAAKCDFKDRKHFALTVQAELPSALWGWAFACSDKLDTPGVFEAWLQEHGPRLDLSGLAAVVT